ncbi:hypothetical protein SMICM304S_11038 [Streptomyces microflavus]
MAEGGGIPPETPGDHVARRGTGVGGHLPRRPFRKDRYDIRSAYRRAGEAGLLIRTETLTPELLDQFIELYERQVAGMRHGWAVAVHQRADILDEADTYCAVTVRSGSTLVGACLDQDLPDRQEMRARFSAVTPGQRSDSLSRVLYWETIREARLRGRRWATLGRDVNLYGHLGNAGLFSFKSRLGFTAVPGQLVEPGTGISPGRPGGRLRRPVRSRAAALLCGCGRGGGGRVGAAAGQSVQCPGSGPPPLPRSWAGRADSA